MSNNTRHGAPHRQGFTLLEISLVIAILLVVAATAWPALRTAFETRRLKAAADQLRTEFGAARVEAMSSGVQQIVRCDPGQRSYAVRRAEDLDAYVEAGSVADEELLMLAELEDDQSGAKQLPEGMTFVASNALVDSRAASVAAGMVSGTVDPEFQDILFYPDGTTSTAEVTIKNERGKYITIQLRGLTGVARVTDWFTAEELPQ